jgi:hypothetical protein
MNWHFGAIAANHRLILNLPPRHVKLPLASVKQAGHEPGWIAYHRMRTKGARAGPPMAGRQVRLCAPHGVGAVQLLSGLNRSVAPDGTVEMSETDCRAAAPRGR